MHSQVSWSQLDFHCTCSMFVGLGSLHTDAGIIPECLMIIISVSALWLFLSGQLGGNLGQTVI